MNNAAQNAETRDGPFFTVLMSTYNRAEMLTQTLETIFDQRFTDFELIVVNDGSTDGTRELIEGYGDKLTAIHQDNAYLGAARNHGLSVARGRYIAIMDDDDLWLPWTLQVYHDALVAHGCPAQMVGRMERFIDPRQAAQWAEQPMKATLYENYLVACDVDADIYSPTSVIRADVLRSIGGWQTARVGCEDQDTWLRMGERDGFVRIEQPVTIGYRTHTDKSCGNPQLMYDGAMMLLDNERAGVYPGGRTNRRRRMTPICDIARAATWVALLDGKVGLAGKLYRRTWCWQVRFGRWKYLLGTPVYAVGKVLRRRRHER